jgi:C1A family cysteine protease
MGWLPDLSDPRDYTTEHKQVRLLLQRLKRRRRRPLPAVVDLRADEHGVYFLPPEDQGPLNCSSVFAILSLVEYFERRALGNTFEPAKLFLYKMARKVRGLPGDSGVDLRSTLKALVRYGVPPAQYWPYQPAGFDDEPRDLSLIGFHREFASLRYFRLDGPGASGSEVLQLVKSFLAALFPVAFGFPVPGSLGRGPDIPHRPTFDAIRGGQAVVAVGYNDRHAAATKGALLVRSSWGETWGDGGYGWLPFAYLEQKMARDFWTLAGEDWLNSGEFFHPAIRRSLADQ